MPGPRSLSLRPSLASLLAALAGSCLFGGAVAAAADGEILVDRIVAVVDGHPVLYTEVMDKVRKGPLVVVSQFPAEESSPEYEQALQDAINFELVLAKAKDLEIDVRDDEVDGEIGRFLESRNITREQLDAHLATQNSKYEDYRADFRDQMILRRFQGRVITPLVKITDKDLETFFLKKSGTTTDLVELVLRQILIGVPAGASDDVIEAKRKLALEVHQKLNGGMVFTDAVKVYSDEGTARDNGGLMAPVKAKDLAPQIRGEVEALDVSKFSAPIRTALGFHIFFLEEKRFAGSQEFASQRKQLEFELRNLEIGNQTRRWLSEQRQKSKVEVIAE
jgi:peptidyl-prolyl cis-trans isomerase SurA